MSIYIKRPFLVIVIGYVIGIIWGLYFSISIAFFYIPIMVIYLFLNQRKKRKYRFQLFSFRRYFRYIKLILNHQIIFILILMSIISNSIVLFLNQKYENVFQQGQKIEGIVSIVEQREEKQYRVYYKGNLNGTSVYLSINKTKDRKFSVGDRVKIKGIYQKPEKVRNEGGFNQDLYFKTKKIYGTVQVEDICVIGQEKGLWIEKFGSKLLEEIEQKVDSLLKKEKATIIKGILLGDTSKISEEDKEAFRVSNTSHILAVSGMHISYLVLGINYLLLKLVGKNKTRVLMILFLFTYLCITGFSPSVSRATIMVILQNIAKLIHRKNNTINALSFSLFIILCDNPYAIMNVGLQFSYLGTIGILFFYPIFRQLLNLQNEEETTFYQFIWKKLKEIVAVIFSVQLVILPISILYFNSLGIYSILSNVAISVIIGPTIIFAFLMLLFSFIIFPIAKIIAIFVNCCLDIILLISQISELPFSKIYFSTPKIWQIVFYYVSIWAITKMYMLFKEKKPNMTQIRVKNIVAIMKLHLRKNFKKYVTSLFLIILIFSLFLSIPKKLKIHFIDVGQGDACLIETPFHKTILIDGGGSKSDSFNVGKSILLPYLLDNGYTEIDYIFISHFDQDHVRTEFCI